MLQNEKKITKEPSESEVGSNLSSSQNHGKVKVQPQDGLLSCDFNV